jgi:CRP-like cAMP-binding protein
LATDCKDCPLRRLELFRDFSPDELRFMQRFKTGEMQVEAGTTVLLEGAKAPQLYTVLRGMGVRSKALSSGRRQVLNFALPGDFLGLQAAMMAEMTYSVEAVTPMRLCAFRRSDIWDLYKRFPERAFDLTWAGALEERFLGEALTSLGQRPARERMGWALHTLYRRLQALGLEHRTEGVPFPFRQQDLADALGLSLVHTNKTLARLRAEQLLTWEEGRLRIPDPDRLAEACGVEPTEPGPRPLI